MHTHIRYSLFCYFHFRYAYTRMSTFDIIHQWHYDNVIMSAIASQITSITVVYSTVYWGADQRKHQSSALLAFVWGIHRDRWIPRTKGQLRGKCFHLITSSWNIPGPRAQSVLQSHLGQVQSVPQGQPHLGRQQSQPSHLQPGPQSHFWPPEKNIKNHYHSAKWRITWRQFFS